MNKQANVSFEDTAYQPTAALHPVNGVVTKHAVESLAQRSVAGLVA